MSDEADPYVLWDAAYVLGSLSSTERREYETHLAGCKACRAAVGELSGMPALLTLLSRDEAATLEDGPAEPPPLRPQMLDELVEEVRRRRRRAQRTAWILSAAAAAVIAVGLVFAVRPVLPDHSPASAIALTMTPTTPSELEATVVLTGQRWGTDIEMNCTYHELGGSGPATGDAGDTGDTLAMFIVGRDGKRTQLGTWTAVDGVPASPSGSTSVPIDDIAAVQVVAIDTGDVLAQRNL